MLKILQARLQQYMNHELPDVIIVPIFAWNVPGISNFLEEKISHPSKVILKILQAMLQQYLKHELPDVKAGFRKGRGTRDQTANIHRIIEKAREFQ